MEVTINLQSLAERRYTLAGASQRFVGRILEPDPAAFLRAIRLLAREVPAPTSAVEREDLRKELAEQAFRGALRLHAHYHEFVVPRCGSAAPVETLALLWRDRQVDPRLVLRLWARRFLDSFAATHPWPPAVRAAMILRKQRRRRFGLDQLAIRTGASRSVLTRGFQRHYGMSAAEYHRRAKLQWVVEQIRQPQSNVESIALRAGFTSLSSLCRSLRLQPRLAPSEIRSLSSDACRDLFDGPLSLAASRSRGRTPLEVGSWEVFG